MRSANESNQYMYPESSEAYEAYVKQENSDEVFAKLEKHKEPPLKPRGLFLKLGVVSASSGSAYMEYGNTKVIASVEPPVESSVPSYMIQPIEQGLITCSLKFASFATRDQSRIPHRENYMSLAVKKALGPMIYKGNFPNNEMLIKIIVLDDDGCVLSTAINCCSAALVMSGVLVFDIVTASTICIYKGFEFVNPTADIERLVETINDDDADEEHGIIVLTNLHDVEREQLTDCYQKGLLLFETVQRLCARTLVLNEQIAMTLKEVLLEAIMDAADKAEEEIPINITIEKK